MTTTAKKTTTSRRAERWRSEVARVAHAIHANLLWILLAVYALAALVPGPGLALRTVTLGRLSLGASDASPHLDLSLPALLLAVLLFNAALGVDVVDALRLVKRPKVLTFGLLANITVPLLITVAASGLLGIWHDADEIHALLVGLALVAAMPIAGSSTAWAQNANGNMALSVGLVLFSTVLSPLLTPLAFHVVAAVTSGDYADDLIELAGGDAPLFLAVAVVVPSMLGMLAHRLIGRVRLERAKPVIKLVNLLVILTLNYSNGSVALPRVLTAPDPDLMALLVGITAAMVALAFTAGRGLGRVLGAGKPERTSLTYALGMNNNGTGLVLAATALGDHPNVILTIVIYNLVQQIVAGAFGQLSQRRSGAVDGEPGLPVGAGG